MSHAAYATRMTALLSADRRRQYLESRKTPMAREGIIRQEGTPHGFYGRGSGGGRVQAAYLALDIEEAVAVSISVLRGDARADRVAGSLPIETLANGEAPLSQIRPAPDPSSVEAGGCATAATADNQAYGEDPGAHQALSTHLFAHPLPLSVVRALFGTSAIRRKFPRQMCIK